MVLFVRVKRNFPMIRKQLEILANKMMQFCHYGGSSVSRGIHRCTRYQIVNISPSKLVKICYQSKMNFSSAEEPNIQSVAQEQTEKNTGDHYDMCSELEKFSKNPSVLSAKGLLKNCNDVDTLFRIYYIMKERSFFLNLAFLNEVVTKCRLLNQKSRIRDVCADLVWVFHERINRNKGNNEYTYNFIITTLASFGFTKDAIQIFDIMQSFFIKPDNVTLLILLRACGKDGYLEKSMMIINDMRANYGIEPTIKHYNTLVESLIKSHRLDEAIKILESLKKKGLSNVFTWNSVLSACNDIGKHNEVFKLFDTMINAELKPTDITILAVLNACRYLGNTKKAIEIFNSMTEKYKITPTTAHYTLLMTILANSDQMEESMALLEKMQVHGLKPNHVAVSNLINIFREKKMLDRAFEIFRTMKQKFDLSPITDHYNIMISTFMEFNKTKEAIELFQEMDTNNIPKDCITWGTIIAGYAKAGKGKEALEIFENMQLQGVIPNSFVISGVLSACIQTKDWELALEIFKIMKENFGITPHTSHYNQMMTILSEANRLEEAIDLFEKLRKGRVASNVSWNILFGEFAKHNRGSEALHYYELMKQDGYKPDKVTWLNIFKACKASNLINEGHQIYKEIEEMNNGSVQIEHRVSFILMLCDSGHLEEAEQMMNRTENSKLDHIWLKLLKACGRHNDLERAERVFQKIKISADARSIMSSMYKKAGIDSKL